MSRSIQVLVLLASSLAAAGTPPTAPPPRPVSIEEQERLLARGTKFLEQGKVDLFVALSGSWKLKANDLRMWEPVVEFGRKLIERAEMDGDRKPQDTPSSFKDFARYLDLWKPEFKRMDETYFRLDPDQAIPPRAFFYEAIQAPGVVDPTGIVSCLILSRGDVKTGTGIASSVVFANGDVTARTIMTSNVIVCDGDVTVGEDWIGRSLIVARGHIIAPAASDGVLMAGAKITLGVKPKKTGRDFIVLKENEAKPLGVSFFELSTVGLDVKLDEKAIEVSVITPAKPFAATGVRVGDIITEVNGKKPDSAESLRRLLRDALAIGDATVTLQRDGKPLTVKVSLPE